MDKSIECLKGVGKARAFDFARIGIHTVGDLLFFFPRTYEDRSVLKNIEDCVKNETVCLSITVSSAVRETRIRRSMAIYTMTISDDTGSMQAVWYNNKYIKNVFSPGNKFIFYGKVGFSRGKLQIENPIYEAVGAKKYTGKIVPIYPLTGNLTQKTVQSIMQSAVEYAGKLEEYLPDELLEELHLADINYSMKNIHFPDSLDDYRRARERFVFDELLTLQLALFQRKSGTERKHGIIFSDISGGVYEKHSLLAHRCAEKSYFGYNLRLQIRHMHEQACSGRCWIGKNNSCDGGNIFDIQKQLSKRYDGAYGNSCRTALSNASRNL